MDKGREREEYQSRVKALKTAIEKRSWVRRTPAAGPRDEFLAGLRDEFLDEFCSLLSAAGIERATIEFDGSGDEGVIEGVEFQPSHVETPDGLEELLEDFVFAVLPLGFEINEGSFGRVVISPNESPRVEVEHSVRTIDDGSFHMD